MCEVSININKIKTYCFYLEKSNKVFDLIKNKEVDIVIINIEIDQMDIVKYICKNNMQIYNKSIIILYTDKKDCYRLAKLFFVNEIEYHDLSKKDLYASLKGLSRQYFYLLQQNVSCKNRYKRLLNICFPELEKIFKSTRIYDDTALNFIKEFPHAEIEKGKRIDALYNNLYKTNGRNLNYYKRLAETIKTASNNSYPGVNKEHADTKNLSEMAQIVQNNNYVINELREKMIRTAKQSPYFKIINSFYGIGEILTSEILGELGNITRFNSPKEIIAFCGLDPTIKQSGKTINVKGGISKEETNMQDTYYLIAVKW